MFTLLRHQNPAVAQILTHSVNLAFEPKSSFKSECRARTGFRLQNETRLQLCISHQLNYYSNKHVFTQW